MHLKLSIQWLIHLLRLECILFSLMTSLPTSLSLIHKKYVNYTGDIILGALFPIHKRGSGSNVCGDIQLEDGVQLLEALLYTVDNINKNNEILPGIRLGVLALDTCDSGTHAMEQSLDFVKGFISHHNEYHEREFQCENKEPAKYLGGQFDNIVGVIGGQSSSVSIQVASLLRLFKIPQISYHATSPQLSDRERFPYFFRTVPSDENEAAAIIGILRYFNWTYVAVVYSDSEYGVHCYEALRDFANDSICFTTPQRVIRYHYKDSDYDQIIRNIVNKHNIRVIILILEKEYMIEIMNAARRLGYGNEYVWLGTDGWSSKSVRMGKEDILEGAIAIQPLISHIRGFDDYFTGLTPEHTEINPWFDEFWERYFRCKLHTNSSSESSHEDNGRGDQPCSPDLRINQQNEYTQQPFIHFVRDAVYAFAYALHDMHLELCGGVPGVCSAMSHIDGPNLIEYLKKVSFKDEDDSSFAFNLGDGPTRYTIVNFQRDLSNRNYQWQTVGEYSSQISPLRPEGKFELKIEEDRIRYRVSSGKNEYPQSTCAKPCSTHQVKVREREDTCCWQCRDCGKFQIKQDDFHCEDCPPGFTPDSLHSTCLPIPEQYIDYRNPLAMAAMVFSGFGILMALFVLKVFWKYNDTPIIKAAGRELSYVLLFGIILSFSATFLIVTEPNPMVCGVMRFFLGFCPTLCYAAIVTKTNRIARIFHQKSGPSVPKTKFISPTSQMIIVGILTLVEVVINVVWIWVSPPDATFTHPDRGTILKICKGLDTYSYMIGFVYPLILIGFCTIYAIQTRKCPGGFNETKYIAFTNYTIMIIWLAFVPLYLTSTSNGIRVVTLAISLSLSGLVEMGCLFFPKIYIVLLKPEKNTKEVVMAPNKSSFATLSNSAPVPSSTTSKVNFNGNYVSSQNLSPEEIHINNRSFTDPSC